MKPKKIEYWTCSRATHRHRSEESALKCTKKSENPKIKLRKEIEKLKEEIEKLKYEAICAAREQQTSVIGIAIENKIAIFDERKFFDLIFNKKISEEEIEKFKPYIYRAMLMLGLEEDFVLSLSCCGYTLDDIGSLLAITPDRVRTIRSRAIKYLRHPSRLRFFRGTEIDIEGELTCQ